MGRSIAVPSGGASTPSTKLPAAKISPCDRSSKDDVFADKVNLGNLTIAPLFRRQLRQCFSDIIRQLGSANQAIAVLIARCKSVQHDAGKGSVPIMTFQSVLM